VFRPAVGAYVTGTINKVEADHVGLLVNGTFNAAIKAAAGLPAEFEFSDDGAGWVNAATNETLQVGTAVRFRVARITHFKDVVSLEGDMQDQNTGIVSC